MPADLPWHPGDIATTADGWRAVVNEVDDDGVPFEWYTVSPNGYVEWPADAAPVLDDVGTAARWLRSCAEVVPDWDPFVGVPWSREKEAAWRAVSGAHQSSAWIPLDSTAVARAVEATRRWLEVGDGNAR